jgi:hypothetical protein
MLFYREIARLSGIDFANEISGTFIGSRYEPEDVTKVITKLRG